MNGLVGRRLGRYEIVSLIGSGGMGEVYRVRATQFERPLACRGAEQMAAGRSLVGRCRTNYTVMVFVDPIRLRVVRQPRAGPSLRGPPAGFEDLGSAKAFLAAGLPTLKPDGAFRPKKR